MTHKRLRRISTLGSRITSLVSVALVLILLGLAASAFLCGIRFYVERLDTAIARTLPWEWVALVCVLLTLLGMSICVITAAVATNRYIRASYDEMFLK